MNDDFRHLFMFMNFKDQCIFSCLGEEWPGFNLPQQESLWDTTALTGPSKPSTEWSTLTDSPPRATPGSTLWGETSTPSSAASSWAPPTSIWGNSGVVGDLPATDGSPPPPGGAGGTGPAFDPFSSLTSIWNPTFPQPGSTSDTSWSFQPPRPDDDEADQKE